MKPILFNTENGSGNFGEQKNHHWFVYRGKFPPGWIVGHR